MESFTELKPKSLQEQKSVPKNIVLLLALLAVAALVAWIAPSAKPNAVFGRLNCGQFWLAVAFSLAFALSMLVTGLRRCGRRVAAFRLLALVCGTVIATALVELAAWLLPVRHQMDNPWYLINKGGSGDDPELPYNRPAHMQWTGSSKGELTLPHGDPDPYAREIMFQTDMEGFRNSEDLTQADIVVIGDSFTEAGNVNEHETFAWLVGHELGLKSRNFGRSGFTAPSELDVLKLYGLKCRPKIVVWQISESNDLADAVNQKMWLTAGKPSVLKILQHGKPARFEAWRRRSPLCRVFDLLKHSDELWPFAGTFVDDSGKSFEVRFVVEPSMERLAAGHPGWDFFSNSLAEGAALCRERGIKLVFVLIPVKFKVLASRTVFTPQVLASLPPLPGMAEEGSMSELLVPLAKSLDVPLIDLTGLLIKRASAGKLDYLPYDTHFSPQGHEAVAELIVEQLMRLNLIQTNRTEPDSQSLN